MKRFILVIGITVVGLIASFIDAFYGLLLYTWYALASPLELTYGALEGSRLSLIVGAVLILTTFQQTRQLLIKHNISYFCIAFLIAAFCSLAHSGKFSLSFIIREMEYPLKIIFVTLLTPVLLVNQDRLRIFIVVIAASIGILGCYYGYAGLLVGSRNISGPGRIGDNNGYAVFLTAGLPFIFFAVRHLPIAMSEFSRCLLMLVFVFGNLLAILLTFSRGGFLAACIVGLLLFLQVRQMWLKFVAWGILLPIVLSVLIGIFTETDSNSFEVPLGTADDNPITATLSSYVERIQTIASGGKDGGSSSSRTYFWSLAIRMAQDNPVFGVGLNQYQNRYDDYDTSQGEFGLRRAVHNTFLLVLAETGFIGFGVFICTIFASIITQAACKLRLRRVQHQNYAELRDYIALVRISLIAYCAGGFFVNCLNHELLWTLFGITIAIDHQSRIFIEEDKSELPLNQNLEQQAMTNESSHRIHLP